MLTFQEMNLNSTIQKALKEIKFTTPTPIQQEIIPQVLKEKRDIIGLAQTGTGKTAAFGLPILEMVDTSKSHTQVLIMSPTRELTIQIANDLKMFSKYIKNLNIAVAYGGAKIEGQIKDLKKGAQIVVATPGRLLDLIRRRKINLNAIEILVLDEADEMLNFGFKEEIDSILENAPEDKMTLLFSATMSKEVARIAMNYMSDPIEISVSKKNIGAENIEYQYYVVQAKNRYIAMKRIIDITPDIYAIVFCRTRQETKDVSDKLIQDGYNADAIHGDLSQAQRSQVMKRFKDKSLKVLVATDVASRGIDVKEITHVINYNLPDEPEIYTHRSGRTGRAGKKGIAIAIIHARETHRLLKVQKIIGKEFIYKKIPDSQEIYNIRVQDYLTTLKEKVNRQVSKPVLKNAIVELSDLTKEQLIEKLLEIQIQPFLKNQMKNEDLNASFSGKLESNRKSKGSSSKEGSYNSRRRRSNRSSQNRKQQYKKSNSNSTSDSSKPKKNKSSKRNKRRKN